MAFWKEINNLNPKSSKLPQRIDDASGEKNICDLWRNKFENVLNCVQDDVSRNELEAALRRQESSDLQRVSAEELVLIIDGMLCNKSAGLDAIPIEFYKNAPLCIIYWLVNIFNSIFVHGHIPCYMSDVFIRPLIKNNLKEPCSSDSYRPIAVATSASKILEKLILNRIRQYLNTSNNQFGFKTSSSTEDCIFSIKEVINYYRALNTPIFACFIDIKSAYDRVSYNKLFCKLIDRNVPKYIIYLLVSWYRSQRLYVKWGSSLSIEFGMKNGIRQGSLLSPCLFNVYVDKLNLNLNEAKPGCHVAGVSVNNFSFMQTSQ